MDKALISSTVAKLYKCFVLHELFCLSSERKVMKPTTNVQYLLMCPSSVAFLITTHTHKNTRDTLLMFARSTELFMVIPGQSSIRMESHLVPYLLRQSPNKLHVWHIMTQNKVHLPTLANPTFLHPVNVDFFPVFFFFFFIKIGARRQFILYTD